VADELAKGGAIEPNLLATDLPLLPTVVAKNSFKAGFEKIWQNKWAARNDCRQTKHWFAAINKNASNNILTDFSRRQFSALVQLFTGHNYLHRHESLVHGTEADCRLCLEDEETSFHVMAECPALARI